MRGKGMWLLHLPGISTCIFVIYTGNANVPELCVVVWWRIIATLENILREQGNEPNFWGHGVRRLGKLIWYNETFATSADSDHLTHPHENGWCNLHADCTIWPRTTIIFPLPFVQRPLGKKMLTTLQSMHTFFCLCHHFLPSNLSTLHMTMTSSFSCCRLSK